MLSVFIYLPLFTTSTISSTQPEFRLDESAIQGECALGPSCFMINSFPFVALLSAWLVRIYLFFISFCFYFDFFALYGKYGTAKIPGIWNKAVCSPPVSFLLHFFTLQLLTDLDDRKYWSENHDSCSIAVLLLFKTNWTPSDSLTKLPRITKSENCEKTFNVQT